MYEIFVFSLRNFVLIMVYSKFYKYKNEKGDLYNYFGQRLKTTLILLLYYYD